MATLTGNSIASTYKDLLQVSNSNAGVDATLRTVDDGEGTASALSISSAAIQVDNIKLDGNTVSATNSSGLSLHDDGGNGIFVEDGGQVGIGMTAPGAKLDVVGGVSYRQLILGNSIGNTVVKRTAISAHHYLSAEQPVNLIGMFGDASDTFVSIGGGLGGTGDFNSATELQFHTAANTTTTNTTAALVIDSSQNVGIGTSSTNSTLKVSRPLSSYEACTIEGTNATFTNLLYLDNTSGAVNDTSKWFIRGDDSEGTEFYIYADGSFSQVSDRRLKENVKDTPDKLDLLNQIRVVDYNRIDDADKTHHTGVIAQELEDIFPHLINTASGKEAVEAVYETVIIQESQGLIEWELKPSEENTKEEIKTWMDSNGLEYNSGDTKSDLIAKIPSVKQEETEEISEEKIVSEAKDA